MKLLGWMHRKLMQSSTEPVKNPIIGNPSTCFSVQTLFDEQDQYVDPAKILSHSKIKFNKSLKRAEAKQVELLLQNEPIETFDFLAIGTLGMELLDTDPQTPTLPMLIKNSANQREEITENDIMLINYELEKFLEAEEKENVNVASERSSHASIITLSNKPIEGANSQGQMYVESCPLQNYLFATSIPLAETDNEVKKEKTSLKDLFKRCNMENDNTIQKDEEVEHQAKRRNVAHFMKKVVKKFHSSSGSCKNFSKNDHDASTSIKRRLYKAVKMFQKKVYPEEIADKQFTKQQNGQTTNLSHENIYQTRGNNENKSLSEGAIKTSKTKTMNLFEDASWKGATNGEHWIKTDADYLVLEL